MPKRLRPLSGLDAGFLYLEEAGTPMHVGSMMVLARPRRTPRPFVDILRDHVGARLDRVPALRRVLQPGPLDLTHPLWLDLDVIDLKEHIVERRLAGAGTRTALHALVARLHAQPLARDRPMWQFTVIEGLGTGEVVLYTKIHHALLDGQGGMALGQALLDPTPQLVVSQKTQRNTGAAPPDPREVTKAALRATVAQFSKLLRGLPATLKLAGAAIAAPTAVAGGLKSLVLSAPRTPFNVRVGEQRRFATLSLPLDEVKRAAKRLEVSLNDLVLAAVSGALREHLLKRDALPKKSLVAAMPVSLRAADNAQVDNQVSMVQCALATHIEDTRERLHAIAADTRVLKARVGAMKHLIPTDFPGLAAPLWAGGLSRFWGSGKIAERLPALANLAISNVPGPPIELYLAGAKLLETYPVSIVTHGLGLNITLQSYAGRLEFGVIADAVALPNAQALARGIERAMKELIELAPV